MPINFYFKIAIAIFFLFFSLKSKAQSNNFELGILPSIRVEKKLLNNWKINFNSEFRQNLATNFLTENNNFDYNYIHTDYTFIATKQKNNKTSYAGGYVLRVEKNNTLMHRFLLQIKNNSKIVNIKFSNRLRFDASFQNKYLPIHRLRYKFRISIPVKSLKVYFNLGNEYVNIFSNKRYDLEIRTIPSFTFKVKDYQSINFGLDYRLNSFINNKIPEGVFWFFLQYKIYL
ncbi:MAG: DUF2490 domain-containing protein [Polaribacter sp.]